MGKSERWPIVVLEWSLFRNQWNWSCHCLIWNNIHPVQTREWKAGTNTCKGARYLKQKETTPQLCLHKTPRFYQKCVFNDILSLICIILLNLLELWLCLFILFKKENMALKCLGDCQDFSSLCVSNGIIQKHALSSSVLTPKEQSLMCPICFCFPYCRLEINQAI